MSRGRLAILALLTSSIMAYSGQPAHEAIPIAGSLRIDNVTIVDPSDGGERPAMSILMDKGKIVSVLPTRDVPPGPPIATVDGGNRFAVPGYNNMHSHALIAERPELLLATMLAEGATGFRQMSGTPKLLKARDEGRLPFGIYSPDLLAMPGDLLFPFNAGSPKEARAEVDLQKQHANFIKIILAPRPAFSPQSTKPTGSDCRPQVTCRRTSRRWKRRWRASNSIEHFGTGNPFWIECSSDPSALRHVETDESPVPWWVMRIPVIGDIMMKRVERQLINPTLSERLVRNT